MGNGAVKKKGTQAKEEFASGKNVFLVALLVGVLGIGASFAYLADSEAASNVFTIGRIDIELSEPGFDVEAALEARPGSRIIKDPRVINNGENAAYIFASVSVPKEDVYGLDEEGRIGEHESRELFSYTSNPKWELIETRDGDSENEYVYAYVADGELDRLVPGEESQTLFDEVQIIKLLEGTGRLEADLVVKAYGIQADNLETSEPEEVWAMLSDS